MDEKQTPSYELKQVVIENGPAATFRRNINTNFDTLFSAAVDFKGRIETLEQTTVDLNTKIDTRVNNKIITQAEQPAPDEQEKGDYWFKIIE